MSSRLRVLVACEFSGIVREAFRRLGHLAVSCDLLPSEIPGPHLIRDAAQCVELGRFDLIIAHPPCTFLTNAGVRWLYETGRRYNPDGTENPIDAARWADMEAGAAFFGRMYNAPAAMVAVENPVMHDHGRKILSAAGIPNFTQSIQPYEFGHLETKRTCLWLRGLPALTSTENVEEAMRKLPKSETNRVHLASPGPDRWAMRSRTFPGIAAAMAAQWGGRVTRSIFPAAKPATTTTTKMELI